MNDLSAFLPPLKHYRLPDGEVIAAHDALEVVEGMAARKFTSPRSRASYRRATAKRTLAMHGFTIDSRTDETFVATLIEAGLLKEIS